MSPALRKYCIEKSNVRLGHFIFVCEDLLASWSKRERKREEKPLLVRSFRRHIDDGMERHASFRDWRLSQGVKDSRIHDRGRCGRKVERWWKTRGERELEAYRERAGWIGKKEKRERETAIIVGKDGGWMLSFGDACIIVYVTWLERIGQRDTEPSGVRLQQRVRRRITTRAIKNFNTMIIMHFCQKEDDQP